MRLADRVDPRDVVVGRRALLALTGAVVLAACSGSPTGGTGPATKGDGVETVQYGDDPAQFFEVTRPAAGSPPAGRGVVVVIHGGFWLEQYDLSLGRPLAASLAAEGWTAVNLEYRRLGNGGGWTGTFDDVAAGIDALAEVDGLDTSTLITLGHSAGGHLAVWAAGRSKLAEARWSSPVVPVTAAVPQAGVLDLALAIRDDLGGGAVAALMGGEPADVPGRYRDGDPYARIPLDVPVRCIHGGDDGTVPPSQSTSYVEKAAAEGADATVTMVDGDHFTLIDVGSDAWTTTLGVLADLADG